MSDTSAAVLPLVHQSIIAVGEGMLFQEFEVSRGTPHESRFALVQISMAAPIHMTLSAAVALEDIGRMNELTGSDDLPETSRFDALSEFTNTLAGTIARNVNDELSIRFSVPRVTMVDELEGDWFCAIGQDVVVYVRAATRTSS